MSRELASEIISRTESTTDEESIKKLEEKVKSLSTREDMNQRSSDLMDKIKQLRGVCPNLRNSKKPLTGSERRALKRQEKHQV